MCCRSFGFNSLICHMKKITAICFVQIAVSLGIIKMGKYMAVLQILTDCAQEFTGFIARVFPVHDTQKILLFHEIAFVFD